MSAKLTVMGVDCASKKSGIAILKGNRLIHHQLFDSKLPPNASDAAITQAADLLRATLIMLAHQHKVNKIVVELTGVTRNANTMRLLCYFEAAAMLAAAEAGTEIERVRTTSVRKSVFGNGRLDKSEVVGIINARYGFMTEDEAEAVVFALHGGEVSV